MAVKKIVIESFEINLGDTKVKLSREQAKELQVALSDALGENDSFLEELRKMFEEAERTRKQSPAPVQPIPWPVPYYPYHRDWWDQRFYVHSTSSGTQYQGTPTCCLTLKGK